MNSQTSKHNFRNNQPASPRVEWAADQPLCSNKEAGLIVFVLIIARCQLFLIQRSLLIKLGSLSRSRGIGKVLHFHQQPTQLGCKPGQNAGGELLEVLRRKWKICRGFRAESTVDADWLWSDTATPDWSKRVVSTRFCHLFVPFVLNMK